MGNPDIQQLSEGAFKYGPFFFSILFVIFLTRWAYKKYDAAVKHAPPLDQKDQNINRTMFLTTFLFGIMLVVVSIVWWWWFKPSEYFFRGEIQNLQPQEDIASDVYYLKREDRSHIANEDPSDLLRNEHFVIFQTRPFRKGQVFELDFAKNHERRTQLWITYDPGEEEPIYQVVYDEASQRVLLKRVSQSPPITALNMLDWIVGEKVLAAATPQARTVMQQLPAHNPIGDEKLIAVLQDPLSDVATKLDAIDALNARDSATLKQDLKLNTGEPFALTVFDLTQHSDTELASKATTLSKRIDIDAYLVDELSSNELARRESAEKILLRISTAHAEAILRRVDITKHEDLERVSQSVASAQSTRILKPTASLKGDRYYVRAAWSPSDERSVTCLEQLFNKELESTRSLKDEQTLMQGKNQRYVYWYSKDWAIYISGEIKKCGGTAEFVHPY
ncbi:MAG TPA: hypothetical protein VN976_21440 [Verrucomicrobiae bacterium]|nr:hypothetical protein [Verrucomicrobiae bacterium]